MVEPRYFPIKQGRLLVNRLEKQYGNLAQAAEATGINYRTLQGIKIEGKHNQVARRTLRQLEAALANPKPVPSRWERRHIEVDRLRPLVLFLEKTYGGITLASDATGITIYALSTIKHRTKRGVQNSTAAKIVQAVQAIRHGDRTFSTYENDGPAHLPTDEERVRGAQAEARWRSVESRIGG